MNSQDMVKERKRATRPNEGKAGHGRGASKNVRFSQETYDWLRERAASDGESMGDVAKNFIAVQEMHKRFLVDFFLSRFNEKQEPKFALVTGAEASSSATVIATNGINTIWLGLADAFWSKEYSQDLFTYANPDVEHIPMSHGPINGSHMNMDEHLAQNFLRNVRTELLDPIYKPAFDAHGAGFLLIGVHSPFFDESSLTLIKSEFQGCDDELGYFSTIFVPFNGNLVPIAGKS